MTALRPALFGGPREPCRDLAHAGRSRDNHRAMIPSSGARWWKLDIHTHTPASADFGKGPEQARLRTVTPVDWLQAFMDAGIDAVVITDHNSGAWIDPLKSALEDLRRRGGAKFRELVLFPGVEITANSGAHILAILPPDESTERIDRLLGAVRFRGERGASNVAADSSPIDVIEEIVNAGGIPLLAHVDAENSAFDTRGNTLASLLHARGLHAIEVRTAPWTPPELYSQQGLSWVQVLGSDSHHLTGTPGQRFPGSHFTWVKMEHLSYSGLRLALLDDHGATIRRSDPTAVDPNRYTHTVIEHVAITEARYCGRSTPPGERPFEVAFSPWLTTIIGGRGTGKSTVIEFMRLALRREDELPAALESYFETFRKVPTGRDDRGALTDATQIVLVFRKDGHRYRILWAASGSVPAIEEEKDGAWIPSVGEVRQRFPVRIFSQGQIFELAKDHRALLRIVSESPEVDFLAWRHRWQVEEGRFLSLRAKLRELEKQLEERPGLKGNIEDVKRKLAVFEEAAHAQLLRDYQRSQHQRRTIQDWSASLADIESRLRVTAERMVPLDIDRSVFDVSVVSEREILERIADGAAESVGLGRQLSEFADEARDRHAAWVKQLAGSSWSRATERITEQYHALVSELAARGISDVGQYGSLVQHRRVLEDRLRALDGLEMTIDEIRREAASSLGTLRELREQLTARRNRFLDAVLRDNLHVRMAVEPYGRDPRLAEAEFRKIIDRTDGKFADDILSEDGGRGRLADLYRGLPEERGPRASELARRIEELKQTLVQAATDAQQRGWFARHLRELPPESIDRLLLWFPPDELVVSYSPQGDGRRFRPLEQGSPGQKTAAILAFLLAHGDEPMILDQPEDDLDNELIYKLIVGQIRANKSRRQVVIVTHNPNIVINGDAELIVVMGNTAGQCRVLRQGSLQSAEVRASVCDVMEGGREALERRYRRMLDGEQDV
jgi:hypothetical protein